FTRPPPRMEFGPPGIAAVKFDPAWNQILGHAELLPLALRDTLGTRRESDPTRGEYSLDPDQHNRFFGSVPRLDFWWLWVRPAGGSSVTYLLFVPIGITALAGGRLWRRNRSVLGMPNRDIFQGVRRAEGVTAS
ncbi:MAG: hypothetical protein R3246_10705, partial [Acidimicrobiia bacterium]|nr:hypothetical protein [Acidimicrobiia bacterium]